MKIVLLGCGNDVFNTGQHAHTPNGYRTELSFLIRQDCLPGKVLLVAQRSTATVPDGVVTGMVSGSGETRSHLAAGVRMAA